MTENCFILLSPLTGAPLLSAGASPLPGIPEEPRTSCCSTPTHKNIPLCLPTSSQAAPWPSGARPSSVQGQALPWRQDNNFCPAVAGGHSVCCCPHPTASAAQQESRCAWETQSPPPDPEATSDGKSQTPSGITPGLRKPRSGGRLHCLVISLITRVN